MDIEIIMSNGESVICESPKETIAGTLLLLEDESQNFIQVSCGDDIEVIVNRALISTVRRNCDKKS